MRRSKSDLTAIDFDSIDVRDVKYLPSSFDGDVILNLPPINVDVFSTDGRSIVDMDKICNRQLWCTTNTTNIQNDFGLFFRRSICVGHLQCTNTYCDYLYCNGGVRNCTEWIGSTSISHLMWEMLHKDALEGSELFGCTKPKFDLPPGLNCDSHRPIKVNYSILRLNTRVRRAWIEGSLVFAEHGVTHTTSMLETDCCSSHWHIVRLPSNSAKRCWVIQANT